MKEPLEKLFQVDTDYFIHIQHLADDPEYEFDYTIYDWNFTDIDGGVIGAAGCGWTIEQTLQEIVSGEGYLSGCWTEVDMELYRRAIKGDALSQ